MSFPTPDKIPSVSLKQLTHSSITPAFIREHGVSSHSLSRVIDALRVDADEEGKFQIIIRMISRYLIWFSFQFWSSFIQSIQKLL